MSRVVFPAIGLILASAARPASAGEPETFRLGLGFGYVSPLADPAVAEGLGGGVEAWARVVGRLGARLSIDIARNALEGDLSGVPWPYTGGDVTFGPTLEFTSPGSSLAWLASVETGPYWTAYVLGLSWTWGVNFGTALVWRFSRPLGLQIRTNYHLYNLAPLDGDAIRCPRTMLPAGTLDRLDVILSLVVAA